MSVIEVLESAKCVVCHDIYEQTILERSCEQALCLGCYEQVIKNRCPACKSEIQLTRLSRDSAKTVTRAIFKCNLHGGTKSAEVMALAEKHKAFYAGRYQLRDPATFNDDDDLAYLSSASDATFSDADSNSATDESGSSAEFGHEEKCISETQSHSSLSPGEDNSYSDVDNESSEVESDDYSSDSKSDDCSLSGDSNDYSSDGEPDDHSSHSNTAETNGNMQPLQSIGEFLSGVLSSVSHFVSKQLGNPN